MLTPHETSCTFHHTIQQSSDLTLWCECRVMGIQPQSTEYRRVQFGGFCAATMCTYTVLPLDLRQQVQDCPYEEVACWSTGILTMTLKRLRPFLASLAAGTAAGSYHETHKMA